MFISPRCCSVGGPARGQGDEEDHRVERNRQVCSLFWLAPHGSLLTKSAFPAIQGRRHELAQEEHRRQAGARDSYRQRPHLVRGSLFSLILFSPVLPVLTCPRQTAKIGSLVDIQDSEDPEGLRVFYYLIQDLRVRERFPSFLIDVALMVVTSASFSRSSLFISRSSPSKIEGVSVPHTCCLTCCLLASTTCVHSRVRTSIACQCIMRVQPYNAIVKVKKKASLLVTASTP
jgi:hypothetical protein